MVHQIALLRWLCDAANDSFSMRRYMDSFVLHACAWCSRRVPGVTRVFVVVSLPHQVDEELAAKADTHGRMRKVNEAVQADLDAQLKRCVVVPAYPGCLPLNCLFVAEVKSCCLCVSSPWLVRFCMASFAFIFPMCL